MFSPISAGFAAAASFTDDTNENFDLGQHENTENVGDAVRLVSGKTLGRYTSQVFDAGFIVAWDNLDWTEIEPKLLVLENDNVGAEPDPLIDTTSRKGEIVGGSFADTNAEDGVYENIGENLEDNTLNWQQTITNVETGHDNYTVRIRGYTSGDEEISVYIRNVTSAQWEWIDNLTAVEKTIENTFSSAQISDHLDGTSVYIKYGEATADGTQTVLYVDLATIEENKTYYSDIQLKVSVSADNSTWSEWIGPSGTSNDNFQTPSENNMENIPENRYIKYIVYFSSENELLSAASGPVLDIVSLNYFPPDWRLVENWGGTARTLGAPTLLFPTNGEYVNNSSPTLDWSDVDGATTYHLMVDNDSNFTSPLVNDPSLTVSQYSLSDLTDQVYYWKVRSKDGTNSSPWSTPYSFTVDTVTPSFVTLTTPDNNEGLAVDQPYFAWTGVYDPSGIYYTLSIDNDPDFSSPIYLMENMTDNWQENIENKISENFSPYYWRVGAIDNAGNENWSEWFTFTLIVPPASSVDSVSLYWENTSPLVITVTASDNDGNIDNVELWYRYAVDNAAWGEWMLFDNDLTPPYSFDFTFDNGIGYYEFYSRAWDERGNYENAPSVADTIDGFDNTFPGVPTLGTPENGSTVQSQFPTFAWSDANDFSGETYDLVIDTEDSFTEPYVYYKPGIVENYHTVENSISFGSNYYWRVRATDNARNEDNWSENFIFTVSIWNVVESWAGTVATTASWYGVEAWTGTVYAPDDYLLIESWSGTISTVAIVTWNVAEGWTGTIIGQAISGWLLVEGWTATVTTTAQMNLVESWYGAVNTLPAWAVVESWTGTISTVPAWSVVESWSGTIDLNASYWLLVEGWSGNVAAPILAPTPVSPADGTNTQNTTPTFQWDNTQLLDNFHLQVSSTSDFSALVIDEAGLTSNSYTPSSGLADNLYYWQVRAFRTGDNSTWSESRTVRVDTSSPATPTLVWPTEGENVNDNTPNFNWDAPAENSYPLTYYVEISPDKYDITDSSWVTDDNWEVTTDLVDNFYYWRVYAVDNAGNTSSFTTWQGFRIDVLPPDTPTVVSPENQGWTTASPNFDWNSVNDNSLPVVYNIEIYYSPSLNLAENVFTTEENYVVILDEGSYLWRLRSIDNAGNKSDWTENRIFSVDNVLPTQVTLQYPDNNLHLAMDAITFEWQSASDVGSGVAWYVIQIDNDDNFGSLLHENAAIPGADNTYTYAFTETGSFYWRVRAVDNGGNEGAWSEFNGLRTSGWAAVESWSGSVSGSVSAWSIVESWAGTATTTPSWQVVESWTGTVTISNIWSAVESWSGTVATGPQWQLVESWAGTVNLVSQWQLVESWAGTVNLVSQWQVVESWSSTITAYNQWWVVETWTGTVSMNPMYWQLVEGWTGTVSMNPMYWQVVETWSGTVATSAEWAQVEGWTGTINSQSYWRNVEAWSGTIAVISVWLTVESWTGTVSASPVSHWQTVENWTGTVSAPVISGWVTVESWTGTIVTPTQWYAVESWTGSATATIPVPTLISPADGTNTQNTTPTLQWDNTQAADNFHLQVSLSADFSSTTIDNDELTSTSFTPSSALADGPYYWRVRMFRTGENSGWSENWTFRVDTIGPAQPSLVWPVEGENLNDSTPNLDWDAPAENSLPLVYRVQVARDQFFNDIVAEALWNISDDNWEVSPALADNVYYWRVAARDNANDTGNSGLFSSERTFRIDTSSPSTPTLLTPENGSWIGTAPTFIWTTVNDSSLPVVYNLEIAYDNDFSQIVENILTTAGNSSASLGVGTYWWRVKSIDNAGNHSAWAENIWFRVENTPPAKVSLYSPENTWDTENLTLELVWVDSTDSDSGVENYWIQIDNDEDFSSLLHENSAVPVAENTYVYTFPDLGRYYWRVRAVDNAGNIGEWSDGWNFRSSAWASVETWSGTITTSAGWQAVETWSATVSSLPVWAAVESWTGTVSALQTSGWLNVETWSGTVDSVTASLQVVEAWTGTVTANVLGPTLVSPANGTNTNNPTFTFEWTNVPLADNYQIQVDNDNDYADPVLDNVVTDNFIQATLENDNLYRWRVRASVYGEVGGWSENWTFRIDRVMPDKPTPVAPYYGENWGTPQPLIDWNAPAENSLPLSYYVEVARDILFTDVVDNSGWISNSYWFPSPLQDGVYYWHVKAEDNVGLKGPYSDTWSFRVDTTGPSAPTPGYPSGINTDNRKPLFQWTAPPENSYPLMYLVHVLDSSMSLYLQSGWTYSENWEPSTELADGLYYWKVEAVDNARNNGENSTQQSFRVDTTPPNEPVLSMPANNDNTQDNTPNLDWQAVTLDNIGNAEASTPLLYFVYLSDNPNFTYDNYTSGWISDDNWETPELEDGMWYWRVSAQDNAGKLGDNSNRYDFRVDTLPPENVALIAPDNAAVENDNTPFLDWAGADDNSLIVLYRVIVSVGENFVENYADSGWIENDEWEVTAELFDNDYYWKVQAMDNAGNLYETATWQFRIENSVPFTPALVSPPDAVWVTDSTPMLDWENAWDISQPVTYYVWVSTDNTFENLVTVSGSITDENWEISPALDENTFYFWTVSATDNDGKTSDNSEIRSFIVDTGIPPQLVAYAPENHATFDSLTVDFRWYTIDDNSGIFYTVQIDDEPTFTSPYTKFDNTSISPYYSTFASTGRYYWRVRAEDGAGNVGPWTDDYQVYIGKWQSVESWSGSISAPVLAGRQLVEAWSATLVGAVSWQVAEAWSGTVNVNSYWSSVDAWSGSVGTGTAFKWNLYEIWSGTIIATVIQPPTLTSPADGAIFINTMPTFEWDNAREADNFRFRIDTDADLSSPVLDVDNLTSNQYTPSGLSDALYYWYVQIFRTEENSVWSEIRSVRVYSVRLFREVDYWSAKIEIPVKTTTLISLGAPAQPKWRAVEGWGGTIQAWSAMEGATKDVGYIRPGSSQFISFEGLGLRVSSLNIAVSSGADDSSIGNISVTVDETTRPPAGVASPPDVPYYYFNLNLQGISQSGIDSVEIVFKVEKSWVSNENIEPSKIRLYRLSGTWNELPTEFVREGEDGYLYYRVTTTQTSLFSIVGAQKFITPQPPIIGTPIPNIGTAPPPPVPLALFAVLGAVGIGAGIAYYRNTWSYRYGVMEKQFDEATKGLRRKGTRLKLKSISKRLSKTEKMDVARLTRQLIETPLMSRSVLPTKKGMTEPERLAIERLGKFIAERRRKAASGPSESGKIGRIHRRITKEDAFALQRLERFMTKRREAAPLAKIVVKKPEKLAVVKAPKKESAKPNKKNSKGKK